MSVARFYNSEVSPSVRHGWILGHIMGLNIPQIDVGPKLQQVVLLACLGCPISISVG